MIQSWPLFITGLIALVPAFLQIRYYYLVRSPNFLWFSVLLLSLAFNVLLLALVEASELRIIGTILSLVMLFTALVLIMYKTPTQAFTLGNEFFIVYIILYGMNFIILTVIFYGTPTFVFITLLRILIEEILQLILGRRLYLIFANATLPISNRRTNTVRRFWMGFGLTLVIMSLVRAPIYFILSGAIVISEELFMSLSWIEGIGFTVLDIGIAAMGIGLFFLSLVFPESMLLTEQQILQVRMLEDTIAKIRNEKRIVLPNEAVLSKYLLEATQSLQSEPKEVE